MNLLHVFLFFVFVECIFWLKFPKEGCFIKGHVYELVLSVAKFCTTALHPFTLKRRNGFERQSVWEGMGWGWRQEEDSSLMAFTNLFALSRLPCG